jgi:hypothetical protein
MRIKWLLYVVVVLMLVTVSGCFSNVVTYVEPSFQKVGYSDLQPAQSRPSVGVLVEFQTAGKSNPSGNGVTREIVIATLQKSNLFASVSSGVVGTRARMEITINNAEGETKGSAYVTGLTMGAVGTKAHDPYIFTASYYIEGGNVIKKEYKHNIYGMVGGSGFGKDVKTMSPGEAIYQIVEDFVLRFLKDLQTEGVL